MEERYDYVLVGGGLASVWAAQNIREQDKQGKIALFGDEPHPPYDRPPFSKNFITNDDMTPDDGYSKYDDFYPKNSIELHTACRVTSVDRAAKSVSLDSGVTVGYGKLLIATGAHARPLSIPGADRVGVFLLRHIEDSIAIRDAMRQSKRAIIIGASYMGMELAADAVERGLSVTVVEQKDRVWPKFASQKLASFIQRYFEAKGVQFVLNDEAANFQGDGAGPVKSVVTKGGRTLDADLVVAAVGAELNTDLAKQAGLDLGPTGGVLVNEFLQTADAAIWAAGDVASFKDVVSDKQWHLEHFMNAKWQGQAVGKLMAGGTEPYNQVPYFFSDFLDLHMALRGDASENKHSLFAGDLESADFVELYHADDGRLTMGVAISKDEKKLDPLADTLEKLIRERVNLKGKEAQIQQPGFDIASLS